MPTTTTDVRLNDLIINKLTQAEFDSIQDKSPNELYVIEGDSNLTYAEQAAVLPTASADNLGRVFQYVGATTGSYINGYFYKCVSDGAVTPTYSWEQMDVQDSFPDQTGQSGKFLTTNGTNVSWGTVDLTSKVDKTNSASKIYGTDANGDQTTYNKDDFASVTFRTWVED